ncbi:MAG: hypothetical protein GY866_02055 [Proteobacteria bacterium]|nr:hypothetical protein [Pseudomonadota bacterium]
MTTDPYREVRRLIAITLYPNTFIMKKELTGVEKTAILIYTLGEDAAAEVLKNLNDQEIRAVNTYFNKLTELSPDKLDIVLEEFYRSINEGEGDVEASPEKDYIEKALVRAQGKERRDEILNDDIPGKFNDVLMELSAKSPQEIAEVLANEDAQLVALVLSYFEDPDAVGNVLKLMNPVIHAEVVHRMVNIKGVDPNILIEIGESLADKLHQKHTLRGRKVSGVKKVGQVIAGFDSADGNRVIAEIEEIDPELARELRNNMFGFESLVKIDGNGLQKVLKHFQGDGQADRISLLALSLKGASEEMTYAILDSVSTNNRRLIEESLAEMGRVKKADVLAVRNRLVNIAQELASRPDGDSDKIVIMRGDDSDYID